MYTYKSLFIFRCESSLRHCNRLVSRASRDANKEVSRVGILKLTVRNGELTFRFRHISERDIQEIELERIVEFFFFFLSAWPCFALFQRPPLSRSHSLRAMVSALDDFKPSHVPLVFPLPSIAFYALCFDESH